MPVFGELQEPSRLLLRAAGYLPGMMLPHIKFFAAMSLLYISLGVAWAGGYARHWKEVFTLQHAISAIVALGMMEMSTWCGRSAAFGVCKARLQRRGLKQRKRRRYFDYVNFNATGYRPYVTTLYAVLLGCARKTISRVLVLIVSMGYGVVLPYLGAIQHKARRLFLSCISPL
jgi:hypothetical protein